MGSVAPPLLPTSSYASCQFGDSAGQGVVMITYRADARMQESREVTTTTEDLDAGLAIVCIVPGIPQTYVEAAEIGVDDLFENLGSNGV